MTGCHRFPIFLPLLAAHTRDSDTPTSSKGPCTPALNNNHNKQQVMPFAVAE
jgi:hypothetical protein